MATEYNHTNVEKKWQEHWRTAALYKATEDATKPKAYVLDMFPYPSGEGLHIGHPKGYTATDVYARMRRMQGYSVLHPMGWDAFGLPAENYAIKNKVHPRAAVEKNIARFKSQLEAIGFDYDWSREINTTDPEYYKWTQWIFLKLYERGLAYESHEPINWCPSCQTGLSNEDLDDGKCERCGSAVEQRPMRQWVLKITEYADRLLEDLELLPKWQSHIKELQRNWIGRSEGAEIDFALAGRTEKVTVFTTRPDTLFGATYMVLAPEHPLVSVLMETLSNASEVQAYVDATRKKTELERQEHKEKTGCELKGVRAVNPANGEEIPLFIADYVLAHYGTGAIMAVPAHDERDHAFAVQFNLPIREVVEPVLTQTTEPGAFKEGTAYEDSEAIIGLIKHWSEEKYLALRWKEVAWGTLLTGGIDAGMNAHDTVIKELREETGYTDIQSVEELGMVHSRFFHVPKQKNRFGHAHVMKVILNSDTRVAVDPEEAAKHDVLWLTPEELGTFLTAASHLHLQKKLVGHTIYTDWGILKNSGSFSGMDSRDAQKKIVDMVGGTVSKTYRLKDWVFSRQRYWGEPIPVIHCPSCGVVPVPEAQLPVTLPNVEHYAPTGTGESPLAVIDSWVNVPCPQCGEAAKRETNTMPQWAGSSWYYLRYMDPHNNSALVDSTKEQHWAGKTGVDLYVGGAEHATRHLIYARFWHKVLFDMGIVSTPEPFEQLISVGLILAEDGRKMSKRFGNVINPEDIIEAWGADTMRLYTMFMGPFTDAIAWNTENMIGARRFLERVWRLKDKVGETTPSVTEIELHKTIKKVTSDIQDFKFNTAIAQMMILLNTAEKEGISAHDYKTFVQLIAPFAPHITEELWEACAGEGSVHTSLWPTYDESKLVSDTATVAVQILGKVRTTIQVPRTATEEEVKLAARDAARKWIEGKSITKEIYVPGKIVNFIIAG